MASTMQLGRHASIGESLILFCQPLASFNLRQVHGSHDKQRPQACEFCRILQVGVCSALVLVSKTLTSFRGIQSAGAAVSWHLDAKKVPYMGMFVSNWVLLAVSLVIAAPVMFWKIKDTVSIEEDLRFSDETVEDVIPQYQMDNIGLPQVRHGV
jgi:hypothetical protein